MGKLDAHHFVVRLHTELDLHKLVAMLVLDIRLWHRHNFGLLRVLVSSSSILEVIFGHVAVSRYRHCLLFGGLLTFDPWLTIGVATLLKFLLLHVNPKCK
jgi:hypothetical protein